MTWELLTLNELKTLPKMDFTENDGKDTIHIDDFYNHKLDTYEKNKLSKIRLLKKDGIFVGYFAVSMNVIELGKLSTDEKIKGTTPRRYPALLIGRMGVDKKYRKNGIGAFICDFCRGLGIQLSNQVGCRYLTLQTTKDKIYFYEKCGFVKSTKAPDSGLYWMYSRII